MEYSEKEILAIFKNLLERDLIDYHKIISWAGSVIQENKNFPDYLIEISLSGSKGRTEIMSILETNSSKIHSDSIWKTVYGFLSNQFKNKKLTLKEACNLADSFAMEYEDLNENYILEGRGLEDVYYLAETNVYGTIKNAEERFLNVTEKYGYLAQNFSEKHLNF